MKRLTFLLFLLLTVFSLSAQIISLPNLRLPFSQKEMAEIEPNLVFFYDATLMSSDKKIKAENFDLAFYVNTYEILESNNIIDSIFVRSNEEQMKEIDKKTWIYSCDFYLNKNQMKKDRAILNIERIDGNCSLFINKQKVREYHNSFMTYRDDVKPYLKRGKNNIQFIFSPKDSVRVNQRSPQYLYGWDWYPQALAPKINAVYLTMEDDTPFLNAKYVQTKKIENNKAELVLSLQFQKPLNKTYKLALQKYKAFNVEQNNTYFIDTSFTLYANSTGEYYIDFTIDNPLLWWPNGAGEQNLYTSELWLIDTTLKDDDTNKRMYLGNLSFGIRTVELVRDKDEFGESFYFRINGKPIFAKGANYILTPATKEEYIQKASLANMNMFRIWGGSDYGDDEFYSLCDKYGIMVWQDFPFACELYPADSIFLANVEKEAIQNVKRISGHPSLVLYCGNNEIWEGWNNWGWKNEVKDTLKAVEDYDKLFKEFLPNIVEKYAPTIDYIHSSPVEYGWGHKESLLYGDCHYWGVWWGDSVFETYTRKVPRFMSEYGFQSVMNTTSADKYTTHPYKKENKDFAIHQKHDRGFELIDNRIHQWFGDYDNDDEYLFFSQTIQQEAIKMAIETHRRNKPFCMGSLFWQYNEPYPCVGWGCIDYSGEEKPSYYAAAFSFQPLIFSIDRYSSSDSVFVYVCSDIDKNIDLNYSLKIFDQNDSIRYVYIQDFTNIKANQTKKIVALAYKDIKGFNPNTDYLWVEGFYDDVVVNNYSFFVYPKDYVSMEKYFEVLFDYYFGTNEDLENF
ncbi:MAG: hypothetical protein IJ180_03345 [Bacteroidales bacterium]|nr:hypothetical protein [Bacteroidales bacterium]